MKKIIFLTLFIFVQTTVYGVNIAATVVTNLPTSLKESSGLINLNGQVWTHTDSGGSPAIYQVNKSTGAILRTVTIANASNVDWEDITMDEDYIYIGDFGNNSGTRTNLKIYRISRAAVEGGSNSLNADIINFSYSDQNDFTSKPNNNNYDCEAFISYKGKLYLFSKNWADNQTRFYELPRTAGTHVAQYRDTYNVGAVVTGASMNPYSNVLTLILYNKDNLDASTRLFYHFLNDDFFSGAMTSLNWTSPGTSQIEGVIDSGLYSSYVSSEYFEKSFFGVPIVVSATRLYNLNYEDYISTYDNFLSALEIPHNEGFVFDKYSTTTGSMTADKTAGSCVTSVNNNVWFKFQATAAVATITLRSGGSFGTAQNLALTLWNADATNELACKKSTNPDDDIFVHQTSLMAGNWYYISVDTASNTTGTFTLFLNNNQILQAGTMRFNSSTQKFESYDGLTWSDMHP